MKLSIIVPAFNEEKLIGGTLHAISSAATVLHEVGWETELIVCDNNSSDRTAGMAREAGAQVVFEPVNQIGRARNRGASIATGEWLLFVDADSRPTAALFGDMARAIQSGRYLAGGATVRLDERHFLADGLAGVWNQISRWKKWVAGSFIFCDAEAFRCVGGFSDELFASEELDLSRKLLALGKERGKTITILTAHPLETSARKMHLYNVREHLGFFARAIFFQKRTLRNREACRTWYDGRR